MDKRFLESIKREKQIPEELKVEIDKNRQALRESNFRKKNMKMKYFNQVAILILSVAVISIIFIFNPKINNAISTALGINRDSAISISENNNLPIKVNAESTQDGLTISLTKFISTTKKYAFEYQFEVNDDKLKNLLKKEIEYGSDLQFIDYGVFERGRNKNLSGGMAFNSTFRLEGNIFYGSVIASSMDNKIPTESDLILHIDRLWWVDRDNFEQEMNTALSDPNQSSFGAETALEYKGDWSFNIENKTLNQTNIPTISNVKNITDINAVSDVLQTTVKFNTSLKGNYSLGVELYKDGVISTSDLFSEVYDIETGEMEIVLNLSALDKDSIYKVQVNEVDDHTGKPTNEIGQFEIRNN